MFGEWAFSHYTDPQPAPNKPADPDNEAGKNNLNNVTKMGEVHTELVPGTSEIQRVGDREARG